MSGVYKNIKSRFATAIIIAVFAGVPAFLGGHWFVALVAILAARMLYEWVRMSDKRATHLAYAIPIFGVIATIGLYTNGYTQYAFLAVLLSLVLAGIERFRRGGVGWTVFGIIYLFLPALALLFVRGAEKGIENVGFKQFIFIVLIVAASDVGAYLGGSRMRGPKIAPKLSPNKTWSGFFSGLTLASIVGMIAFYVMGYPVLFGLILTIPLVVISVIGDFMESAIKRKLEVKDTGNILPGHGGVLDRLDALIATFAIFAVLLLINPAIWPS